MKRIFPLRCLLASSALAAAAAEPQEVQTPEPELAPLTNLVWRLPAKYATLEGDRLVVDIPADAYPASAMATAEVPAALLEGAEGFSMTVEAAGSVLAKPTKSWLGLKFQMHWKENATGTEAWPNCRNAIGDSGWKSDIFEEQISEAAAKARAMTAWRLEGTLREFAKFDPVNCWFRYPVHVPDESGVLSDIEPETEKTPWDKAKEKRKKQAAREREADRNALEIAFTALESEGGDVPIQELAEHIGKDSKTIGAYLGDGKKAKADWKKSFEKFTKEDGKTYVRRVSK